MRPVRVGHAAVAAVAALTCAATANAATVSLTIDPAVSSVTSLPVTSGGRAYMAPFSLFKFVATVTNDVGQPALPVGTDYATVDLIARTVGGDKVVSTQTIFDASPVRFPLQALDQTTSYYARVNAAPANGVAVATPSAQIRLRAFLRSYPNAFFSSLTRTVNFSGFYSKPTGVSVRASIRVVIQRRVGKKWATVARPALNSTRNWKAKVSRGTMPAVFRVRTVPLAPVRYVPATELRYCVATTLAAAKKACRSVALGLNEAGSPTRTVAVAAND